MFLQKIAFLFLTYGQVHHTEAWKEFFENNAPLYSIYVHSKSPLPESYFSPFELPFKIPTTWANTMDAQIAMLREALKDPANEKFIFVSETTIPLQNFSTVYSTVFETEKSIFFYEPNPHQFPTNFLYPTRNLNLIPAPYRYKNAQWVILNRAHAELMIHDTTILPIILQYQSDQEHYPSTFLATLHLLHEVEPRDLTYVNWTRLNPPTADHSLPYIYTDLSDPEQLSDLTSAIRQGYLFARKLAPTCNLTPLKSLEVSP